MRFMNANSIIILGAVACRQVTGNKESVINKAWLTAHAHMIKPKLSLLLKRVLSASSHYRKNAVIYYTETYSDKDHELSICNSACIINFNSYMYMHLDGQIAIAQNTVKISLGAITA